MQFLPASRSDRLGSGRKNGAKISLCSAPPILESSESGHPGEKCRADSSEYLCSDLLVEGSFAAEKGGDPRLLTLKGNFQAFAEADVVKGTKVISIISGVCYP